MIPDMQEGKMLVTKEFYGQAGFPQPFIHSTGFVTSAGVKDTSFFFVPNGVTVQNTATGVFKITHNIGYANRYILSVTPVGTANINAVVANQGADTVEVRTFNTAGSATDAAFCFILYSF